jgi:sulfur carrier protein
MSRGPWLDQDAPLAVTVNGEPRLLAPGTTVAELVGGMGGRGRGVAVAVDGQVVPRSAWGGAVLWTGAVIEVVTAAAGG